MQNLSPWPFDQSPGTAAITTRQVLSEHSEIRVVVHYENDHSWAFLCGGTNHADDGRVISMGEALEIDPSLVNIADLPQGWRAERSSLNGAWIRSQSNDA
jgi:hypothetical protein